MYLTNTISFDYFYNDDLFSACDGDRIYSFAYDKKPISKDDAVCFLSLLVLISTVYVFNVALVEFVWNLNFLNNQIEDPEDTDREITCKWSLKLQTNKLSGVPDRLISSMDTMHPSNIQSHPLELELTANPNPTASPY